MKNFKFGPDFLHSEFKNFVLGYHAESTRVAIAAIKAGG